MIIKLVRLTLCFALFYSAQSAAYNEAMCILIKQEMQQNSNNKASRQYRKAARDYKNNCNKPKQVQTQPKPQISEPEPTPIVTQPQPLIVEPAPVVEPIVAPANNINEETLNLTDEQKQQINEQLNTNDVITIDVNTANDQPQTQTENEQSAAQNTINNNTDESHPPAVPPVKQPKVEPVNTAPENTAPIKVLSKPAPIVTPLPANQNSSSLLLPTLIIVIVVLIGAMVLVRIRRAKQQKTEPVMGADALVKNAKNEQSAAKKTKQPEPTAEQVNTESTTAAAPIKKQHKAPSTQSTELNKPIPVEVKAKQANLPNTKSETQEVAQQPNEQLISNEAINTTEQPVAIEPQSAQPTDEPSATFSDAKQKTEPNTAEFEAAAKTTLERIKSADEFSEPQIREFDPDAKPVKRKRNHGAQITEPTHTETERNTVEHTQNTPEPITPSEPVADLHTPNETANNKVTSFATEHDFKEPEVRTFDPSAPLPGKKPAPKKAEVKVEPVPENKPENITPPIDAPEQAPSKPEPAPEPKKADSSNPFANLSLDESWDPNSAEKPKIEEKKRAPKSQALIDAEERAKNMKTKE
ncbi:cell surface protein [Pseudoalteromonas carrageenovora]|uniref:cell surface protein n=1 Tax=Pseudoalteromonas carrageenovora TaxID=227 RepID=UPI0026E48340|nr:cell surface protein [Pseudoalteromonas carrageenovora]MDO6546450.1 cell surface protein [Pseudoalteromonas carrageenovora]MDO6830989.1 cell surface protein [Pseudoalteromonas carrageenovora]